SPLRFLGSKPWHLKQFSESIGRTSRLKSTLSGSGASSPWTNPAPMRKKAAASKPARRLEGAVMGERKNGRRTLGAARGCANIRNHVRGEGPRKTRKDTKAFFDFVPSKRARTAFSCTAFAGLWVI